jgi:hypothetical protein
MQNRLFPSCAFDEALWATMSNSAEHGVGVHSWHVLKSNAEHNALTLGGWVVPATAGVAVAERLIFHPEN